LSGSTGGINCSLDKEVDAENYAKIGNVKPM